MPAIRPARLKVQVSELVSKYNQPAVFVRDLHALLDLYTDHTQHAGQSGSPTPLLDSYNTPPPVMRQVWRELMRVIKPHPLDGIQLCDALWAAPNYDLQLLAARLLGQLPINPPDPVINRMQAWVNSNPDQRLLHGLLEYGLQRFQQEAPDQLLELISSWLSSKDLPIQRAGLRALLTLINDAGTAYLPAIFRQITPYLRVAHPRLRPDILAVVTALAHCSPSETAYLLHQNLSAPDNPDTPWLIRQVLEEFPEESRLGLRSWLKGSP
jgi:DNA alkylation repair enzyme